MRLAIFFVLALLVAACGSSEAAPTPSTSTSTPAAAPPSAPCSTDADCRLESATGCACISVLASSPEGPGCPHPCAVAPCTGNEAFCHAGSSTCRVRPSMH